MRRLAILLVAIVAAGALTVTAAPPAASARSRPGATGCSISLWTRLYGGGVGWNGPSYVYDCRETLRANALHTYSGRGSGTIASGMIAHSCLTLWFGSKRGSPFCWESRLAPI